ncbi:MAG: AbrB/MazE/SpoVT family DNA-binding domain-containing protein [Acidimicrobiales bacterium]|nr:AbrB/MazE/SpoVT family DNA-binding domain-containing protein [Acidimicrobiales bacterium]
MGVVTHKVSERGQMALPAETRRRWDIVDGGAVDVVDLGDAVVIIPAVDGGVRALLKQAVDDAGGYPSLAAAAIEQDPELA